jgi:PAS domain S-box-containing protein
LKHIRVLIAEDNPADAELVLRELRRAEFDPQWHRVETEADYRRSLRPDLDLILSDFEMPEFNGLRALELLKESGYEIPFIMVSGTIGEETSVVAIKKGAADYLMKDRLTRLGMAVSHALEEARLRRHSLETEKALSESQGRFRVLFDVAEDAMFTIHHELFVDCNIRGLALFGLPREQIVGRPVFLNAVSTQLDGRDSEEKARELFQSAESGAPQSFEWILNRPDGKLVYCDVGLSRFEQGDKVYIQAIARDITEWKRAEKVLRGVSSQATGLQRRRTLQEFGIILALCAMVFFIGYFSGLSDIAFQYLQSHNSGDGKRMDETMVTLVFFCLAMLVFSYRRWRESRAETFSQKQISHAMGILHNEMEAKVQQRTSEVVKVNEALRIEVTERKVAEDAVSTIANSMAAAQRIAHIGSWEMGLSNLTELNANTLHWSHEIFRIAGYEPGEVEVSNELFFRLVPAQEHVRIQEAVKSAIAQRMPYSLVHRLIRPSGEERTVHELAHVIMDEKNRPLKLIGTTQDITERKKADFQIAEQAALLDKAQDAIVTADLETKIQFWNKGAERMYGWSKEEATGKKIIELIAADPELIEDTMPALLEKGDDTNEVEHLTKDGRRLTVEARRTLIRDDDGKPQSLLAIYTDVTGKKKIEAQFMRAQRMESIGTLAGGIAHDLNNILAPIMMSIDLLKSDTDSPQTKEILETIETSAKRGADIVRQVLSFARGIESERIEIQPKHILKDLEHIIKDTFPKNVRMQFSVPNDTWTIWGDPTQVHQILLNLCVNARDAMPNGGTLTLGVENSVLDEHYAAMNTETKAGRYVNISVTDSGTGVLPAIRDKIFEPFFTTKDLSKGTGLGLSTVASIVKSHHGIIEVCSEIGKGTTFKVYLPAMEFSPNGRKEQPEQTSLPRGRGETVLVVDDEASILAITSQTLKAFGYRVLTATDGADAVAVYAQHPKEVTLVLTDMNMPVMDGPSVIRALKRMNPALKIVAASGLNANGGMTNTSEIKVPYFLTKPYTAATLLKTLRQALDEN